MYSLRKMMSRFQVCGSTKGGGGARGGGGGSPPKKKQSVQFQKDPKCYDVKIQKVACDSRHRNPMSTRGRTVF